MQPEGQPLKGQPGLADIGAVADQPTANDRDGAAPLRAGDFAAPAHADHGSADGDLHVCPNCGSGLVYPVEWAPADNRSWQVELRCPDCEWRAQGVHDQAVVDRFDEVLDLGTEALLRDLGLLARSNMEDAVERFVTALHAGWVIPEDF